MPDDQRRGGVGERSRCRVMVAEDDVDMAHVLRFLLQREGHDVISVHDGREATRRIREDAPPDLALIDLMMPFLNGYQVVRAMRATPGWARVPVIVVSGRAAEEDIVEALEAGANDYVTKPFRPRELVARVRGLLERHGATRVA